MDLTQKPSKQNQQNPQTQLPKNNIMNGFLQLFNSQSSSAKKQTPQSAQIHTNYKRMAWRERASEKNT